MPVNTNAIIHFTNSFDNIESILTNNFLPRLCLEDYSFIIKRKKNQKIAVPMVCFCDIPLHLIRPHMKEYGYYGIGMRKIWAKRNKLNPVVYIDRGSDLNKAAVNINNYMTDCFKNEGANEFTFMWNMLAYMKPYRGTSIKTLKWKAFYDEREWRYIPNVFTSNKLCNQSVILQDEYVEKKDEVNNMLKAFPLKFDPKDIKYLIVDTENEIPKLLEIINRIKSPKYSSDEIDILKTKIITSRYMLDDF